MKNKKKTVNSIHMKIKDLETNTTAVKTRVTTVENTCLFMSGENDDRKNEMKSAKTEINTLKGKCSDLENSCKSYMERYAKSEAEISDLESRSMRDNLPFYGVPEGVDAEDCEYKVKKICAEQLQLLEAQVLFNRSCTLVAEP